MHHYRATERRLSSSSPSLAPLSPSPSPYVLTHSPPPPITTSSSDPSLPPPFLPPPLPPPPRVPSQCTPKARMARSSPVPPVVMWWAPSRMPWSQGGPLMWCWTLPFRALVMPCPSSARSLPLSGPARPWTPSTCPLACPGGPLSWSPPSVSGSSSSLSWPRSWRTTSSLLRSR